MIDEIDDLTDAIIEDTVHCDLCGGSWVLGSYGDGICVNSLQSGSTAQLKLCMDRVAHVARAYELESRQSDRCEHDVLCGDWCEPCHADYRRAREENGDVD